MEFIDIGEEEVCDLSEDEDFIVDFTEMENNNPSEKCGLTNITRTSSNAEQDNFFQSDMDVFLDEDIESRNFLPPNYDNNEENSVHDFANSKTRVNTFKNILLIHRGKR